MIDIEIHIGWEYFNKDKYIHVNDKQWKLSKINKVRANFCVRNRQVVGLYRLN
jgi:hypothetical protein